MVKRICDICGKETIDWREKYSQWDDPKVFGRINGFTQLCGVEDICEDCYWAARKIIDDNNWVTLWKQVSDIEHKHQGHQHADYQLILRGRGCL